MFDTPTIADEATTEAPAAEAVAEEGNDAARSYPTRADRLREILEQSDRMYRDRVAKDAEQAEVAAARQQDAFKWEPTEIRVPRAPPAVKPDRAGGPPLLADRMTPANAGWAEGPPEQDLTTVWILGGAFALALFGISKLADRSAFSRASIASASARLGRARRRHSALLIVLGLGVVATSLTVLRHPDLPYEYSDIEDMLDAGWLTFAGLMIALIGMYDKLKAAAPPKI